MKFLYKNYQAKKKEVLEAVIGRGTRVKFMSALDFKLYRNARTHKFYGGTFAEGTVRFVVPFDAVWYVVVEMPEDGLTARTRHLPVDRDALSTVALDAPREVRALNTVAENGVTEEAEA